MINPIAIKELREQKKIFIRLVILSILVSMFMIGQAYGIAFIINEVFLYSTPLSQLTAAFIFTIAVVVLRIGAIYFQEATAQELAALTKKSLRKKVISHMMALGPMSSERYGETVHLMTDGLDNVEAYIARYLPQMAYAVGIPLFMAIAMMWAVPWVGILLFITYPLIPFFMILIGKKAGKMNEEQWERMSFLSGHFLDVLKGLSTLKLYNRSQEQGQVIGRMAAEFRDSTLRVLRVAFLSSFVLELVSTISTAIIAVYTGVALLFGEISYFPAFFILLLAPEFYLPLRELGAAFHTGMAGEVALKKSEEFLAIPSSEPKEGTKTLTGTIRRINCEKVSYTYYGRNRKALDQIQLTLVREKRTMLVGESGAGKSSLAHMLLRMLTPQEGRILVEDSQGQTFDLLDLEGNGWRDHITFVPQRPYLFKGTIASNIAFGRKASREEIIEAAKKAEAHQFIMDGKDGYDREMGEGGAGLSGGEAQRIALARAFLAPGSFLILDEVSAHLDVETEQALSIAIERLMEEKIVLLIGHRVETMKWADHIVVMREGLIVQEGSYEELKAKEGYFQDLLRMGGVSFE